MAKKTTLASSSVTQYTQSYGDLRGVDLSSDPAQVSAARPSYLINMYRDYDSEHGAAIETIPGFRRLFHFGGRVHGIWVYSSSQEDVPVEYMVVHAGTGLFTFRLDEKDSGSYVKRFDRLLDGASSAFLQNNNFYICDGVGIYVMKADLSVVSVVEEAYVPITYLHGAAYEQRNMITDRFINRDTVVVSGEFNLNSTIKLPSNSLDLVEEWLNEYYTWEKKYQPYRYTYTITGFIETFKKDTVIETLSLNAFDTNSSISGNKVSATFKIPLETLLKSGVKRIFLRDEGILDGTREEYKAAGIDTFIYMTYADKPFFMYHSDVYIYEPCIELTSVKVNDIEIHEFSAEEAASSSSYTAYMPVRERVTVDGEEKEYISYIMLFSTVQALIDTHIIDIEGVADPVKMQKAEDAEASLHIDYLNANTEYDGTTTEAIMGCRIACTFDGRVFLTGNEKLPNTVFYSCRDLTGYNNPTYFGVYNFFNDGEGNAANVALLATSNVLMVLKRDTVQGSSVYYHVGADGIDDVVPRIYPSTPGVAGIGCEGAAINFLDDAIFLSERGLEGVSKEQLNLERTIGHRSSNVDRLLRGCDLSQARMCRWGGYLCIFDGTGRVFLGDSRQMFQGVDGTAEYEWYYLEGVGDYSGDRARYRTVTQFPELRFSHIPEGATLEGATVLGDPLTVDQAESFVEFEELYTGEAEFTVDGEKYSISVKYVERDGAKILCDSDLEIGGGEFSPSVIGFAADGVLFFGTEDGSICCFNTDKRGVSVDGEAVESDAIHRSWYTFAGHRYLSGLALKSDNCGVPHLTKRTVRKSCVAKLKTMRGSSVTVKVRTDRMPWHELATSFAGTDFSFSDMEFDNFSFVSDADTIVTIKDKEKKWVEKQFYLLSDGYCRPFGLHSLTFNYEIQGRVKKG